jgi:hypothetical protein
MAYARKLLSGTPGSGQVIAVAATATPGTLIHTAVAGADPNFDEIYLWASNVTGSAATLTIEWGGVTDPTDHVTKAYSIPANSPPIPIVTGLVLNGALEVRAFSGTASAINISGYVNRIS